MERTALGEADGEQQTTKIEAVAPYPPPFALTTPAEPAAAPQSPTPVAQPAPPPPFLTGAGEACPACGASMAPDQHYCLECGERRGKARFSLTGPGAPATAAPASAPPPEHHPQRMSPSATFIAAVATLILAMLVGVLIGHFSSSSSAPRGGGLTVVNGGGGGGSGGGGSGGAGTGGVGSGGGGSNGQTASASSKHHHGTKVTQKVNTKTIATPPSSVSHGAQLAGHSAKLPPPTAQQGQSCAAGTAGCQNGQLTGNFFGGP